MPKYLPRNGSVRQCQIAVWVVPAAANVVFARFWAATDRPPTVLAPGRDPMASPWPAETRWPRRGRPGAIKRKQISENRCWVGHGHFTTTGRAAREGHRRAAAGMGGRAMLLGAGPRSQVCRLRI